SAGREVLGDDSLEVLDEERISIRECRAAVSQAAFSDEVGEEAHEFDGPAFINAKDRDSAGYGYRVTNLQIMYRNPSAHCEEGMMPCYLHLAATVGADTKGRLSPTINPVGDRCRLDMPVRRQIKRVRQALANTLLDGQARAGLWIVNQCSSRQTLPNRR